MNYRKKRNQEISKLFEGFELDLTGCRKPQLVQKVYELCKSGLYSKDIAEMLNITPKTVQKIYRRYDFPDLHNFFPPRREERQNWKGGLKMVNGYRHLRVIGHPHMSKNGGYVAEHRLVMEKKLGRYLAKEEVVDHIDGNPSNNHPDNLRVFENNAEHLRVTLKGRVPNWSEDGKKRISEAVSKSNRLRKGSLS